MAHNLATIDGRIAMAYQGESPWHHLGTRMPSGLVDVNAALAAASLDWTIHLEKVFLASGVVVPQCQAVVRDSDNAILSTVSDWYKPIQYRDAFSIFQPSVEKFGLTVEAAGALGKGERAWMLFRLPVDVEPVPGDRVNGYGLAFTGHDGKTACEFRPTPIRVVCQNTLDAAIGQQTGKVFSIQHIGGNVERQVREAASLVENVIEAMKTTGETFGAMARRAMSPQDVAEFVEKVFPADKKGNVTDQQQKRRESVLELLANGVGADIATQATDGLPNAWSVYNAVTEYIDHVAPAEKLASKRNQSALFGTGAELKMLALRQASRLVAA